MHHRKERSCVFGKEKNEAASQTTIRVRSDPPKQSLRGPEARSDLVVPITQITRVPEKTKDEIASETKIRGLQ